MIYNYIENGLGNVLIDSTAASENVSEVDISVPVKGSEQINYTDRYINAKWEPIDLLLKMIKPTISNFSTDPANFANAYNSIYKKTMKYILLNNKYNDGKNTSDIREIIEFITEYSENMEILYRNTKMGLDS